ncbi:MAG TPA: NADP-dependent oxidoreductase [Myxococcales bacterium]|jgi:NADPH2:quinone reductase|nr:NADP-dependent oxidoreductase [Myxococcales bacterium]
MRIAIQMERPGPPEVLVPVELPDHAPPPDEVVVRSAVSGVNRADLFIRSGEWEVQSGKFPYVPGLEVAGVVEQVGANVTSVKPGDRVITMMQRLGGVHGVRPGGYQSHVCVHAGVLAAIPDGLDTETAGTLGLPAVTAEQALRVLSVHPGDRVLVQGGSSAVGTMAIQMVRALGGIAIGTGQSPAKFELMRRCGAKQVVDTRGQGWSKQLDPVHGVIDLVGAATFQESVSLLRPGGRLVFVGGTTGGKVTFSAWDLMGPVTLTGYSTETLTRDALAEAMQHISLLAAQGRLAAHQVLRVPLKEAARAHREMESGAVAGRVVLTAG